MILGDRCNFYRRDKRGYGILDEIWRRLYVMHEPEER
jgi:hypothetical protein